ncbi:hypothetical protein [Calothrix sp. PCC 7507]|uniref:hypothetical protein n=1 Tax=Calothrix sp. PCC 7507 TaxID=99598 RepID=UPI00350FE88C
MRQNIVEITIQEPRPFNVLEEFIIRAGIEFDIPPTGDELASILGLDPIFVRSTIKNLQNLQTLAVKSPITVTAEGRTFYEQGTVLQPPYSVQIYAITEPLEEKIIFQSQSLSETRRDLTDSANFINIDHKITDISALQLEKIQQIIQDSDLEFHIPEKGKIVTAFRVLSSTQTISKEISLLVIVDQIVDKLSIQIRNGKQVLELPSNTLAVIADKLWVNALKTDDSQLAIEPLCIWGVLGMEELALTAIQQNSWLELLAVWLNVVLKSKKLTDDLACFQTALALLNQITGEEDFLEQLRIGWREVIGAIATYNYESALNLLSSEVWAEFIRLEIALEDDLPDKFISQYTKPQSQETKVKRKKRG